MSAASSTGVPKSPIDDSRVGWIHELRRQQLEEEMARYGLPTEGTVEHLRRVFCEFWRRAAAMVGEASVRGLPPVTTQSYGPAQIPYTDSAPSTGVYGPPGSFRKPEVQQYQAMPQLTSGDDFYHPSLGYAPPPYAPARGSAIQPYDFQHGPTTQPPAIIVSHAPAATTSSLRHGLEDYRLEDGARTQTEANYFRQTSVGVPLTASSDMHRYAQRPTSLSAQPPRQPDTLSANPYAGEHDLVRELLGISPNADTDCLRRTLASMVQGSLTPNVIDNRDRHRLNPVSEPELREEITPRYAEPTRRVPVTSRQAPQPEAYRGVGAAYQPPRPTYGGDRSSVESRPSANLCDLVRKWNLRFDGRKDAVSFLERLEELLDAYAMTPDEVLRAMPELLHGQALLWFRNNREFWDTFVQFRRMFEAQFFPPGYRRNLDEEIRKRTQGETESFREFVIALTTLVRRSGEYSNQQKLNLVYSNMRPEYKFMIRRQDFTTLPELIERAEEFEELVRERKTFRPPPPASQALVPETAYVARKRQDRAIDIAAVDPVLSSISGQRVDNPVQSAQPSRPDGKARGRYGDQNRGKRDHTRWTGQKPSRNQSPAPRSPPPRTPSPRQQASRTSFNLVCWNCEKQGHRFSECDRPKVRRCFFCKRANVNTTECCGRLGNGQRTQASGGYQGPPRRSGERPPTSGPSGSTV